MDFNSLVHDSKEGHKHSKVIRDSPRRAEHSKAEKNVSCAMREWVGNEVQTYKGVYRRCV